MKIKFDMEIDDAIIDLAIERARESGGLVAVVRCSECEYYQNGECIECEINMYDDDYCSRGRRKGEQI